MLPNKPFFRPESVAEYYDVNVKTVYGWIDQGKMDAVKVGGSIRIPRHAIINAQEKVNE